MTITTASFAKALWPGVNSWYGQEYDEYPVEYTRLFESYTDDRAYVEDVGTSGFGLPVIKPQGESIVYDNERQGFTTRYVHYVTASGFIVTREAFEDDQYGVIAKSRAQGLAFGMRQAKEINGANILNRAFNTSYLGGDAKTLINTAHPNVSGGTWSNQLAVASDLSEAALEQSVIDIAAFRNDRGLLIKAMPKSLIIAPTSMFEAERILKSTGRVSTADNDLNALNNMGYYKDVIVNHFLTDTDAWFIKTNVKNGLKYFTRRPMQFGIDNDFDTENAKFKSTERYSFGWTDPRAIYGTPGA